MFDNCTRYFISHTGGEALILDLGTEVRTISVAVLLVIRWNFISHTGGYIDTMVSDRTHTV